MKPFNFEELACNDSGLSASVLGCLEYLSDKVGVYGGDLHNELFNSKQEYICYANAEKDLDELGTWACIKLVFNYEKFNFGEVLSKVDACQFANMVVYIVGECLLRNSEHLNDECWDKELEESDLEIIRNELQAYLESLNDDLTNIAFEEWENI